MINIDKIAENADVIINGYAYTADGENIRVINLNNTESCAVINGAGEIIETTMEDVEVDIVLDYYNRSRSYMGD